MGKTYDQRNMAIDIVRALTMMLMIFVNDLWSIEGYPEWLGHSAAMDDFMGLADIVFPCFLIAVGLSIPYAIEKRMAKGCSGVSTVGHILSRSLALMIMGVFTVNSEDWQLTAAGLSMPWFRIIMVAGFFLVWNAYPRPADANHANLYKALKLLGVLLLVFLGVTARHGDGGYMVAGWWGILGIIGWTYLVCSMLYLFVRDNLRALCAAWCIFAVLCCLKSILHTGGTILDMHGPNFLDQALDILHIGTGCSVALTTGGMIISVATVHHGLLDRMKKMLAWGFAAGAVMLALGIAANHWFITSKIMATAPWMFYNLAIMSVLYAAMAWMAHAGHTAWFRVIKPAGTSTLTCYIVPYVTYSAAALLSISLPMWLRTGVTGIINCIVYAFFVVGITCLLGKLRIKLKV